MSFLLHIAEKGEWENALRAGRYKPVSFERDGFIHCSTKEQVVGVANALFAGREGLLILCIEPEAVASALRWENLDGESSLFPHIYASVCLRAVAAAIPFECDQNGTFSLPLAVEELCRPSARLAAERNDK